MNDQLDVEVFRAGDYGEKGRWDEATLDQIAGDYNPALHEAPVTLDHARSGPALGWVAALRRVGDRLVARLRGLNLKLLELLRAGTFKKRSVELYPALRETGRPYLRAVSFLGAAVPEVKGLADPLLPEAAAAPLFNADDANTPALCFEEEVGRVSDPTSAQRADLPEAETEASGTVPSGMSARGLSPMPAAPLAFDDLAARLRAAGTWRPAWAERGLAEFWNSITSLDAIAFTEAQHLTPAEWFVAFLESLPPVVSFGESAPPVTIDLDSLMQGSANVDPASLALHRAAVAFQQASPGTSYAEALLRCSARK